MSKFQTIYLPKNLFCGTQPLFSTPPSVGGRNLLAIALHEIDITQRLVHVVINLGVDAFYCRRFYQVDYDWPRVQARVDKSDGCEVLRVVSYEWAIST